MLYSKNCRKLNDKHLLGKIYVFTKCSQNQHNNFTNSFRQFSQNTLNIVIKLWKPEFLGPAKISVFRLIFMPDFGAVFSRFFDCFFDCFFNRFFDRFLTVFRSFFLFVFRSFPEKFSAPFPLVLPIRFYGVSYPVRRMSLKKKKAPGPLLSGTPERIKVD